jgi:hypothetical protein
VQGGSQDQVFGLELKGLAPSLVHHVKGDVKLALFQIDLSLFQSYFNKLAASPQLLVPLPRLAQRLTGAAYQQPRPTGRRSIARSIFVLFGR